MPDRVHLETWQFGLEKAIEWKGSLACGHTSGESTREPGEVTCKSCRSTELFAKLWRIKKYVRMKRRQAQR